MIRVLEKSVPPPSAKDLMNLHIGCVRLDIGQHPEAGEIVATMDAGIVASRQSSAATGSRTSRRECGAGKSRVSLRPRLSAKTEFPAAISLRHRRQRDAEIVAAQQRGTSSPKSGNRRGSASRASTKC
jgi:hypothetical protein